MLLLTLFVHVFSVLFLSSGHACPNDQFLCNNGECIKFYYRCNKDTDCIDGSDEANCSCLNDEFQCEAFDQCIPQNQFCDGERNCQDGSDERVCGTDVETLVIK